MFTRRLRLPAPGTETFFRWGPRQAGKTTLLAATYPDAVWIDLLKADRSRSTPRPTARVTSDHLKGLRSLAQDHRRVKQRVVVCLERRSRRTDDGILILSATDFHGRLSAGDLF